MTSEAKFKEMAIQYVMNNPDHLRDTGTFKQYLVDSEFRFDEEDMRSIGYGQSKAWEQKAGNIICHKSMRTPGVVPLKYDEPAPADLRELASWSKPQTHYYFAREGSSCLAQVMGLPGVTVLVE